MGVGGRYGFHSGSGHMRNCEVDERFRVAGNEMPIQLQNGDIYYVDKTVSSSGDGRSWGTALKTVTEGLAALSDYDTLIIGPGNYDEAAKMTLTGLKGVRIFGASNGFSWGEGSTCIRDVTSEADLLDLTGNQSLEIAGITFVNSTAKDAINFTGLNYATHIHDCNFVGNCGGADMMDYAINTGYTNGPQTYVHHCKFDRIDVAAITCPQQRFVCHDCLFIVADAAIGIDVSPMTSSYHAIFNCNFCGAAGDNGDQGIDIADNSLPGRLIVCGCNFAGCVCTGGGTDAEIDVVNNYASSAAGGAIEDPT